MPKDREPDKRKQSLCHQTPLAKRETTPAPPPLRHGFVFCFSSSENARFFPPTCDRSVFRFLSLSRTSTSFFKHVPFISVSLLRSFLRLKETERADKVAFAFELEPPEVVCLAFIFSFPKNNLHDFVCFLVVRVCDHSVFCTPPTPHPQLSARSLHFIRLFLLPVLLCVSPWQTVARPFISCLVLSRWRRTRCVASLLAASSVCFLPDTPPIFLFYLLHCPLTKTYGSWETQYETQNCLQTVNNNNMHARHCNLHDATDEVSQSYLNNYRSNILEKKTCLFYALFLRSHIQTRP